MRDQEIIKKKLVLNFYLNIYLHKYLFTSWGRTSTW